MNSPTGTLDITVSYSLVPSGPPTRPVSSDVTSTSFTLMWQPPPLQTHNGIITHYKLQLENTRTSVAHFITVHSSSLSHNVVDLSPYTSYECSVAALTVNGTGPYSSEHSVQTSEDG